MVADIVQTAISSLDDVPFTDLHHCPFCGGKVQGYDTRRKKYAVIRNGTSLRTITVRVKRFTCRECRRLINADEPFYPDTRIGSTIVDLFFTLSSTMPRSKAARMLDALGIVVDRTTWKNYTSHTVPDIPAADIFGMRLPLSMISLSTIAATAQDGIAVDSSQILEACNFPSSCRKMREEIPEDPRPKRESATIALETPGQGLSPGFPAPVRAFQVSPDTTG